MISYILAAFLFHITIVEDMTTIAVPRPAGANASTATYLETRLATYMPVERQPFSSGVNIVGTKTGLSPDIIIIGSHYDSAPGSPGADDNASGCVLNLLLAKRLQARSLKHTVKFVFFDNEENGLYGSKFYAKNLKTKCKFMINLDMVGHLQQVRACSPLDETFKNYPWARGIVFRSGQQSDHASFLRRGIPVIWVFTGDHPLYHTPKDTPDTIDYEGIVQICEFLEKFIIKLDSEPNTRIIRNLPIMQQGVR